MALNSAAAHIESNPSSSGAWDTTVRGHTVGPAPLPQQQPIIDLRHTRRFQESDPDVVGDQIADSFRRNIDEKFERGSDLQSSRRGFYGDHRDASVVVFSIAAFEAQLFVQDGDGAGQPRASHDYGTQLYQDIKTVLERALASPTDAEDVFTKDDDTQQVNLLA